MNFGVFINNIIVFLITAFAVFLLVRSVNRLMRKQEAEPEVEEPHTKECPVCFTTIPIRAQRCPNCTSTLSAVSD